MAPPTILLVLVVVYLLAVSVFSPLWHEVKITRPYMQEQVRPYVLTVVTEQALKPKDSFRECATAPGKDYCPQMVVVSAGSFMMGSPPTESGRNSNEDPQHQGTIARPFAVSKFELTFDEWDTCVVYGDCRQGISDNAFGRGQQPVINVTWHDAQHYVAWLSKMTGKPYRLLTEAEYEYVARAGTQTAYPWGDDIGKNNANCNGCGSQWDGRQTAPVGSFADNGFGLYDMVGNVFSWVEDCYHPTYEDAPKDGSAWTSGDCKSRVGRGGSWRDNPVDLRSASRGTMPAEYLYLLVGFRVGRTLMAP